MHRKVTVPSSYAPDDDRDQGRFNQETQAGIRSLYDNLQELSDSVDARIGEDQVIIRESSDSVNSPSNDPLVKFLDPHSGNLRYKIDHGGYPSVGGLSRFYEDWRISSGLPEGWNQDTVGTGTHSFVAPASGVPFARVDIATGATSGSSRKIRSNGLVYFSSDIRFVFAAVVKLGSAVTSISHRIGLEKYPDIAPIQFRFEPTAIFCDAAGNSTNVGTTTANAVYRLKIQVIGDDNHSGANFLIRFFIDGTPVCSNITALANPDMALALVAANTAAVNRSLSVGPVECIWNHSSALDTI